MQPPLPRDGRALMIRFAVVSVVMLGLMLAQVASATDGPPRPVTDISPSNGEARMNLPPAAPSNPSPADNSTNQGSDVTLLWDCSDPEHQTITYDVYLDTNNPPALLATNFGSTRFNPVPRQLGTVYYWRIIARDASGAETSGPIWTFTTRANSPPNIPVATVPVPGQTGYPIAGELKWGCSDPDQQPLVFDLYFGTAANPPLVTADTPYTAFTPPAMQSMTTYYWRIVARDTYGAETSGPVWSFTTSSTSNQPPSTPSNPSPTNGFIFAPRNPVLSWNSVDPDGNPLFFDITVWADNYEYYQQTTTVPHLAMSNLTKGITYSWRVVATDGDFTVYGPIWTFHVSGGNTNRPPFEPSNPSPPNGATASSTPLLRWQGGDADGDPVQYGVWMFINDAFALLGTTMDDFFQVQQPLTVGNSYSWYVTAFDGHSTVQGQVWSFNVVSGGVLPVLFHSFDARQSGSGAELRWELRSDDSMESYTLYRREGKGAAAVIMHGPVAGTTGSYLDNAVEAGRTYNYELLVRTANGDEFRSQTRTILIRAIELTLYQNQPNPFNPETTIRYDLPAGATRVRLLIADVSGRRVRTLVDETQSGGARSVIWNGHDDGGNLVASGVYFYVLEAGKQRLTKKLVLLK